ncbi:hypothetical protein [Roseibacillus ishigakijimensis]|uniref:Uncharacterized protein n=1 Tax=Roseibacillus ishigakijimensis TaxID=454146 RepID=A0A934RJS9_9BACT|nr:hypothetical protein [Roseibacillus ishigakijimensis]MBK1832724.1 hypothetical protein [Roseibacillus ishigakijimensis]
MKPLPLLLTLAGAAVLAAIVLVALRPDSGKPEDALPDPAPLPISGNEMPEPPPSPQPPLIAEPFTPDRELLAFVEKELALNFAEEPVFTPVPAETIISKVTSGLPAVVPDKDRRQLNLVAQRLGALPPFQPLDHTLITILAGEVRGLVTADENLIMHDFQASSPPEQAALVNLLAQRLARAHLPPRRVAGSLDELLARHFAVQVLALKVEKKFRETLPSYPPSLNENIRESILLGLPAFFHELSTFAEFHLLARLKEAPPAAAQDLLREATSSTRRLLAYPLLPASDLPAEAELGALTLYLFLLESSDPATARTLATGLRHDSILVAEEQLTWSLQFDQAASTPRVAEILRGYFSLRDPEGKVAITVAGDTLEVLVRP